MKCPDCRKILRKVVVKNNYGMIINLDQCFDCGGIWFDNVELYPIPKEEIERIENIDAKKLQENISFLNYEKKCPVCDIKLEDFKDINFPKQLEVEYCTKCNGFWMNRGETSDFKVWQNNKRQNKESEENLKFRENIKQMLGEYKTSDYKSLGEVGKFLSMPLDSRTGRPINYSALNGGESKITDSSNRASFIIFDIFQLLLKLFLRY
ncbi:zf-TFIIB domain-containing protein [Patescibacteria group bacterium]|nr:zf-TFIIB domain-containing protein [Patescibacteria group bacterium]